jgi:maltooligosyltrehalose trehalohydrolase
MQLLPLNQLGPRELVDRPGVVLFGLFLPWVAAENGNRLYVKIIHEQDQFLQEIQPLEFELSHSSHPVYGDYWSGEVNIGKETPPHPQSAWGSPGRYVYRYCLSNPNAAGPIDWIIDPFAREFGVGKLSALTLGYEPHVWSANELTWKTPALDDLIIYELMITEFGGDIDGTIKLLDYLADLGVNCLEVMPVTNVANVVDWGFLPNSYFGVDERFGKRRDMQRFIEAAHQRGLAVIMDSVYGHTSDSFPYQYVYDRLAYHENPFMGPFAKDYFGKSTDFHRAFTRDFFYTVNNHWLECYHIDGFRYDCVPNYYEGPQDDGYASLVYNTYQLVKSHTGEATHWQRFFVGGNIQLIQCAEQLEGPRDILEKTYSTCTWQNETLDAAQGMASQGRDRLTDLGFRLGLMGYPASVTVNDETLPKSACQYIENHDHSRFVCNFARIQQDNDLLSEGDRGLWYKVQPYLMALLTSKGIPLLWQGQEFGENYYVPPSGWGRVMLFRPVRWDYFYDAIGKRVIWLVRRLLQIRRQVQFRQGEHYFYNDYGRYQSKGVLLFSRAAEQSFSLVALNFSDESQSVPFVFPLGGNYREELHGQQDLIVPGAEAEEWITIPSNYGCIWTSQPVS